MTPELGAVIGLIILSVHLLIKRIKKKKPIWGLKTRSIFGLGGNASPELTLFFQNTKVDDVYQTKFVFFNQGNDTIREDDVTDNITIHFKGCKLLQEPSLIPTKGEVRFTQKVKAKGKDSTVQLSFRYLDHNDGAVVDMLHTKYEEITWSGNIIGCEIGRLKEYDESSRSFVRNKEAFIGSMWMGMFGFFLLTDTLTNKSPGRLADYILALREGANWEGITLIVILTAAFSMFLHGMVRYFNIRRLPRWVRDNYLGAD